MVEQGLYTALVAGSIPVPPTDYTDLVSARGPVATRPPVCSRFRKWGARASAAWRVSPEFSDLSIVVLAPVFGRRAQDRSAHQIEVPVRLLPFVRASSIAWTSEALGPRGAWSSRSPSRSVLRRSRLLRPRLNPRSAAGAISPFRAQAGLPRSTPAPIRILYIDRGFAPRFLPAVVRPSAVAVRFDWNGLLSMGLSSTRQRPRCAPQKERARSFRSGPLMLQLLIVPRSILRARQCGQRARQEHALSRFR